MQRHAEVVLVGALGGPPVAGARQSALGQSLGLDLLVLHQLLVLVIACCHASRAAAGTNYAFSSVMIRPVLRKA
jgi:hypothetical protein